MGKIPKILSYLSLLLFLTSNANAQNSLAIDSDAGYPSGSVSLPIHLTATEDLVGANAIITYDPSILGTPTVEAGDLATANHQVFYEDSPPGVLHVLLLPNDGVTPFTSQSGDICQIEFPVLPTATEGTYTVGFLSPSRATLPSSGLANSAGASVTHTATDGNVTILTAGKPGDTNNDGKTDILDLFYFAQEWESPPNSGNSASNPIVDPTNDRINLNDLLELLRHW